MKKVITALIICLLLTGCWDEIELKKMLFVDVIGIDYEGDSKQLSVNYVVSSLRNANQGGGVTGSQYIGTSASNLFDAVNKTNKKLPGILSVLETRLYLISTRFAKDQPLDHLNIVGQFSSNPLYGHLAMYDGDLPKLLDKKRINEQTVSDYLVGMLDDEKERGTIPTNKLLDYILGGREFLNDFALNRFEPYENGARLTGTALFRDGKYTGVNLNNDDTLLAHLMDGGAGVNQLIIGKVDGKDYTVLIKNAKRDFHIISKDDGLSEIEISLKLDMELEDDEGHGDVKKHTDKMLKELEKGITDDITTRASNVIATLQKANCDDLQLGHEVAAYHPELFAGMNWREQYPMLSIKPKVKIKILNTGILD